MVEHSFSRFVYLDTNIISRFAKDERLWPGLLDFLSAEDLTLGIGAGQVAELSDARRLHLDVVRFFVSVPSGIMKGWDEILVEEVGAHPHRRSQSLLSYPLNAILAERNGFENLVQFLSSERLTRARAGQLRQAEQMAQRHSELKANFPPESAGTYARSQADEFAELQVLQWLAYDHRDLLERFQSHIEDLELEVFLSVRLFGYVIFYKYYLGARDPKRLSDFGDLFHLSAIPYCEMAVMERDLCNILSQIKRNHSILQSTAIHNIDFLGRFSRRRAP